MSRFIYYYYAEDRCAEYRYAEWLHATLMCVNFSWVASALISKAEKLVHANNII
jgi:hypothetical protein